MASTTNGDKQMCGKSNTAQLGDVEVYQLAKDVGPDKWRKEFEAAFNEGPAGSLDDVLDKVDRLLPPEAGPPTPASRGPWYEPVADWLLNHPVLTGTLLAVSIVLGTCTLANSQEPGGPLYRAPVQTAAAEPIPVRTMNVCAVGAEGVAALINSITGEKYGEKLAATADLGHGRKLLVYMNAEKGTYSVLTMPGITSTGGYPKTDEPTACMIGAGNKPPQDPNKSSS